MRCAVALRCIRCDEKLVFWIRHGHSEANAALEAAAAGGRAVSSASLEDAPLSGAGQAQARALGAHLRTAGVEVELVVVSPLRRALETAWLAFPRAPLSVLEALRERHSGHARDRRPSRLAISTAALRAGAPSCDTSGLSSEMDPLASVPEALTAAVGRSEMALRWLAERGPERCIAVVSHGWLLSVGFPQALQLSGTVASRGAASPRPPFALAELRAGALGLALARSPGAGGAAQAPGGPGGPGGAALRMAVVLRPLTMDDAFGLAVSSRSRVRCQLGYVAESCQGA